MRFQESILHDTTKDSTESILIDKTKKGNVRPWQEKKLANVEYYELLHILDFRKTERVKACAEILEYKVDKKTLEKHLFKNIYLRCGFVNHRYVPCVTGGKQ